MKALTVEPGKAGSLRLDDLPEPLVAEDGHAPSRRSRWVSAARTSRSSTVNTGWHLRTRGASCSVTSPWGASSMHRRAARSRPAIWSSRSSAGPTPSRARPAPTGSGTCAATASTPRAESGAATAMGASAIWSSPSSRFRSDNNLGLLAVLLEPTTVVAKAWEQIERIGSRAYFAPRRALVTAAGPIGLLAALLGVQRGLEVHVLDRMAGGPKPELVRDYRRRLPHRHRGGIAGSRGGDRVHGSRGGGLRDQRAHLAKRHRLLHRSPGERQDDRDRLQHECARHGPAAS